MAKEKIVSANSTQEHVSTAFKWFHATSVNGGAMVIAAVIASYFSVFMTDTMKLPVGLASLVMLIASLWDAINDPIMGYLPIVQRQDGDVTDLISLQHRSC